MLLPVIATCGLLAGSGTDYYTKDSRVFDAKNGSELNVADVLEDETTSVEASIQYEELKKEIANVVSTLKEREQSVIKMRFGLENFARTTLEDIGKMFGVTKECIRQTEMRALNKLRGCSSLNCYAD